MLSSWFRRHRLRRTEFRLERGCDCMQSVTRGTGGLTDGRDGVACWWRSLYCIRPLSRIRRLFRLGNWLRGLWNSRCAQVRYNVQQITSASPTTLNLYPHNLCLITASIDHSLPPSPLLEWLRSRNYFCAWQNVPHSRGTTCGNIDRTFAFHYHRVADS